MNAAASTAHGPVAVLGAGTIGAGWAAFFALSGLEVRVFDTSPQASAAVARMVERARPVMGALGLLSPSVTEPHVTQDVAEAVAGVTHIQEALPEHLQLKREVYAKVEAHAPHDALFTSSSSGIRPSLLQESLQHPERFLVVHPCNPPYLMPLVEIVGGEHTAPEAIAAARAFYEQLGKKTIVLRREVTGHLVNRLQAALWREAVHLVAEGVVSVEDADLAVTAGLGARWGVCGPHEIFHLSGGDQGMQGFLERLGPAIESWWADLGEPVLDEATCRLLVEGMREAAHGRTPTAMAEARDRRMLAMLQAQGRLNDSQG